MLVTWLFKKFDGRPIDWQDNIITFKQVTDWNEHDSAQQLIMSLKGNAQKLSEYTRSDLQDYARLKVWAGKLIPLRFDVN